MNNKKWKEFLKRYDKFKKCNMPVPFFDDERQTLEYVCFDGDYLNVSSSLERALERIVLDDLYYPFTTNLSVARKENGKFVFEEKIGHSHAHSFEEVIKEVYNQPNYFKISKEDEKYYSRQELRLITSIKEYLKFIGFKDKVRYTKSKARYINKKQKKYANSSLVNITNEEYKMIESGKINFLLYDYDPKYSKEKTFSKGEVKSLLVTKGCKFKYFVEFTEIKINLEKKKEEHYFKILEKFD